MDQRSPHLMFNVFVDDVIFFWAIIGVSSWARLSEQCVGAFVYATYIYLRVYLLMSDLKYVPKQYLYNICLRAYSIYSILFYVYTNSFFLPSHLSEIEFSARYLYLGLASRAVVFKPTSQGCRRSCLVVITFKDYT